ncbi:MAG: adenylosuccinate lyase [Ruaniaceae bacterium]|nr:adenylosuccinate lyase [Ruaniaceae bacterium]
MDLSSITPPIALGPLDGRYRGAVAPLVNHLSESALNRARLVVEIEWLIHLTAVGALPGAPTLSDAEVAYLRAIPEEFGAAEIAELAEIEAETRHDVKAIEYFLKRRLESAAGTLGKTVLPEVSEIVHIFCTSEDINNLAYALVIRSAVHDVWLPAARMLRAKLISLSRQAIGVPMLARTHGQAATPVTLGKELAVFTHRLTRQLHRIEGAEYLGKINGATGTYAAHVISVPGTDWEEVARTFVEGLGLTWNPLTTQIESHDWQAELYSDVARFNRVLHNLATDVWTYISLGYFRQNLAAQGSTGSSTMPHKVNPIRFENAEANLELSSALFDTLASTLVTSRLQRDLTDSTTQRNISVAFGHSLLALDNVTRGLAGLEIDAAAMARDLEANWEVLGEAVQSAMRAAGIAGAQGMANPYERLKDLTRGRRVDAAGMRAFIASLGMPRDVEARLLNLSPSSYIGLATVLARHLED